VNVTDLDRQQATVAIALLVASVLALPFALHRAFRVLRGQRGLVALGMALAAAIRIAAPARIATVFIGYHLTDEAISLTPISRYGAGASTLYHALFRVLPADHRTLMRANTAIGVLTLPLIAAFAARMFDRRRAGVLAAFLVALTPIFVRNDNSDANNVPCMLWMFGALVCFQEFLRTRRTFSLVLAVPLAALASIGRPEFPALVLFALAAVAYVERPRVWRDARVWNAGALFFLALAPHVLHVARQVESGGTGQTWLEVGRLLDVPGILIERNTVLHARLFPPLLAVCAVFGVLLLDVHRRRRFTTALLAIAALAIYVVDLDWANMARVHVPGALFVTILAAAFLSGVARSLGTFGRVVVVLALAGSAVPSARMLFSPTNEETEEQFIRAAIERLPRSERFAFVRIDHEDGGGPGAPLTHRYFPDYLLPNARILSIRRWLVEGVGAERAYFFAGIRCYAEFRQRNDSPPHGLAEQDACAEMRRRFVLEPVLEWNVENHGDVWLEYYGDAATLPLALYAITPRPQSSAP
jgi:hypothetical protein